MRQISLGFVVLVAFVVPALAAEPTGEWLVADGVATVRIENCGGTLWGVVASEKQPGVDRGNPDPAKRGRPTLGIPVLLGMKPAEQNRWDGEIYNAQNGKVYSGHISLASPDVLHVQGCVLGMFCGGQDWTRVKVEVPAGAKPGTRPRQGGAAGQPAADVCSLTGTAGPAHERRLK